MDCSLLCPWNYPGMNTRVGCHFLLQGIFPTQGLNLGLLHCRQTLYHLSHQGSTPSYRKKVQNWISKALKQGGTSGMTKLHFNWWTLFKRTTTFKVSGNCPKSIQQKKYLLKNIYSQSRQGRVWPLSPGLFHQPRSPCPVLQTRRQGPPLSPAASLGL